MSAEIRLHHDNFGYSFNEVTEELKDRLSGGVPGTVDMRSDPEPSGPKEHIELIRRQMEERSEETKQKIASAEELKKASLALFKRHSSDVEQGENGDEKQTPIDILRLQTNEGFNIVLTKSTDSAKPVEKFVRITYIIDGVMTDINISKSKKRIPATNQIVSSGDEHAKVSFFRGNVPLLRDEFIVPEHSDTLAGILDIAKPMPRR